MVRGTYVDKNGVKKGAWSEEEDNKLRAYILRYGHWNWRLLPKFAGLERCGKSCRLRWMNYLKPSIKRGNYSEEEKDLIAKLHHELGNKWSAIAAKLPGRTDNDIKNYWHTHLRKREAITSNCRQQAEISQDRQYSEVSNCKNLEETFAGSDVTSVASKLRSQELEKSEVPSHIFILESSSSNLVVSGADDGDLDSNVEQNSSEILSELNPLSTNLGTIVFIVAVVQIYCLDSMKVSGLSHSWWIHIPTTMILIFVYQMREGFFPLAFHVLMN